MMNTADRSLAIIDYALRRRFAFFEFEPAFDSDGFKALQSKVSNAKFDAIINLIKNLNSDIEKDASLGKGFRVEHSYFCTDEIVDDLWLSNLVEYELIPLIEEYWFDEQAKIDYWSKRMRDAL